MSDEPCPRCREYVERELDNLKIQTQLKFEARDNAAQVRLVDLERRLESMNEFRTQLSNERGSFLTHAVYEARQDAIDERLRAVENATANLLGKVGAVVLIVSLAIHFWK